MRMKAAIGLTSVIALAAPTAVGAQPSVEGYSEQEIVELEEANDRSGSADPSGTRSGDPSGSAGATLPFTGLDLALLAGGGVLLAGTGLLMRRLTRSPETS